MDNLQEYVRGNFDGILVVGDTHGEYEALQRAYDYAKSENFFFASLGDLVDRGRRPYETVMLMYYIVYEGRGAFVVGNHDDKFVRYSKGAKVSFSRDSQQTLADVGEHRMAEFLSAYAAMVETPVFSDVFHQFDDITLVHAAAHPAIWENNDVIRKTERNRYIVGETCNQVDADGYPVRLYNWINDIPAGKTVVVGHDKQPIHGVPITEPMVVNNDHNGTAIFMDTGCGKGGHMSGMVIMPDDKKRFTVKHYMEFK